jgi:DNA-binding MarR family transcriptional regulator
MSDFKAFSDLSVAICRLDRIIAEQMQNQMGKGDFRGIIASSAVILLPLLEREGQTLSQLGKNACMKAPTITVIANNLEKMKLVRRVRGDTDRRLVHLYLTEAGRAKARAVVALRKKIFRKLANGVTGEMLIQANDTLNKILKNVYDVSY